MIRHRKDTSTYPSALKVVPDPATQEPVQDWATPLSHSPPFFQFNTLSSDHIKNTKASERANGNCLHHRLLKSPGEHRAIAVRSLPFPNSNGFDKECLRMTFIASGSILLQGKGRILRSKSKCVSESAVNFDKVSDHRGTALSKSASTKVCLLSSID
jgi:hypothetical protein